MSRVTKSGQIDGRTKEGRKAAATMPVREIEQMLGLVYPGVQAAARRYSEAAQRVVEFRSVHPELAELETAAMRAMDENNQAVLPVWGLLAKLEEQDYDRWKTWCAFFNGEGPDPRG